MRIENYNTFAQSRLFSGTGKIGNVQLPDLNDFHFNTKQSPAMSEDKYEEAIIEQAKKDQSEGKFQSDSAGFRNLVKSYVSVASPNRKGIITDGLTAIFKNNIPRPKTLDIISLMFGEVKYQKETKNLSYAEFYDGNGEMVASYSNGGWTFYGTKEENARESKLLGIYNAAWRSAAKASQGNSNDVTITDSINITV